MTTNKPTQTLSDSDASKLIDEAITKALAERGHINVLIAGRSGVGKSTLINAVFQGNMAETGQGRAVTKDTREITKEGLPLTIFDTRGLEMSEFKSTFNDLEKLVRDRCTDRDSNRHIHLAWLCIQEDGRRVEDAEIDLHTMLAKHMPVVVVITKARNDNGFRQEALRLLPESKNAISVRAISEIMDEGLQLHPKGLKELIDLTSEVIPEGKRRALAAAQNASVDYKKLQSHKIVLGSAVSAATVGAIPIPLSDAALLAPIQIGMIAGITSAFGLELTKSRISTLVTSSIGVTGASFLGRAIVSNLLKLFPPTAAAGSVISASTASALTLALGEAYIAVLAQLFTENSDANPSIELIAERLKSKLKAASAT